MLVVITFASIAFGGSLFPLARSIGYMIRRDWRNGFRNLGGFAGLFVSGVVAFFLGVALIAQTEVVDPADGARALAEMISAIMNWSAWLGIASLLAGIVDAIWLQRRRTS